VRCTNLEALLYAVLSILLLIYLKECEQVLISCGNCLECHTSLQNADYPTHNNQRLSFCPPADTALDCVTALIHSKNKMSYMGKYRNLYAPFQEQTSVRECWMNTLPTVVGLDNK
jgi:hypothetical protein